jgi:hypothetical protein
MKTTGMWHDGGKVIERQSEDVAPILEECKALASAGLVGSSEMWHAAKIPRSVIENYVARMADDQQITRSAAYSQLMGSQGEHHWKKMLNDPNLSGFRIHGGRV